MSTKQKRESARNRPNNPLNKTEIYQGKPSTPLLPVKIVSSFIQNKKMTLGSIKPTSIGSAVTEDTSNPREESITNNPNKNGLFPNANLNQKSSDCLKNPNSSKDKCSPAFKQKFFSDKMCVASLYKKIYGLTLVDAIKTIDIPVTEDPKLKKQDSKIATSIRPVVKNPLYQSFDFNFEASVRGSFRKKAMNKLKQKGSVSKMNKTTFKETNSKSVMGIKGNKNTKRSVEKKSTKVQGSSSDLKDTHENFLNSYRQIKNGSKDRRMVSGPSIFKEKLKSTIILG